MRFARALPPSESAAARSSSASRASPHERDLGARGAADLLGDDVEVDERRAGRDQLEALGRDLAELAADDDQAVRLRDQVVGDARIAAEQAGRERMRAGDRALAGHRVRDRDAEALGEREQRVVALARCGCRRRPAAAAARPWRSAPRRARDRAGRGGCGAPAPSASPRRPRNPRRRNRARRGRRPPARRAPPGPGRPLVATAKARRTSSGMRLVTSTRISSLTAGLQDFDLPRLLGHVLPGMLAVGVAGDRDHRHAGVQRLRPAPVTRLVAPGPSVASQTPGRLVTRA